MKGRGRRGAALPAGPTAEYPVVHSAGRLGHTAEPQAKRGTMTQKSHETLVTQQFGPRAAAYLGSPVHAQGDDLQHLVALVRGRTAARVLDLGCGGGHVSFHVAREVGEITAYDLSAEMLAAVAAEAARRGLGNLVTRRGAVEELPFDAGTFDIVLSRYSAHHWHDWERGLREARRVVKPGGFVAFADCVSPGPPLLDTYLQAVELLRELVACPGLFGGGMAASHGTSGFCAGSGDQRPPAARFQIVDRPHADAGRSGRGDLGAAKGHGR